MPWLKPAVGVARLLVPEEEGQFESALIHQGLDFVDENAGSLEFLGKVALKKALIHRSAGNLAAAKTWADRAELRKLAQGNAIRDKAETDAAWALLESFARAALSAALPFILAAL